MLQNNNISSQEDDEEDYNYKSRRDAPSAHQQNRQKINQTNNYQHKHPMKMKQQLDDVQVSSLDNKFRNKSSLQHDDLEHNNDKYFEDKLGDYPDYEKDQSQHEFPTSSNHSMMMSEDRYPMNNQDVSLSMRQLTKNRNHKLNHIEDEDYFERNQPHARDASKRLSKFGQSVEDNQLFSMTKAKSAYVPNAKLMQQKDQLLGQINKFGAQDNIEDVDFSIIPQEDLTQLSDRRISMLGLGKSKLLARALKERVQQKQQEISQSRDNSPNVNDTANRTNEDVHTDNDIVVKDNHNSKNGGKIKKEDKKEELKRIFTKAFFNSKQTQQTNENNHTDNAANGLISALTGRENLLGNSDDRQIEQSDIRLDEKGRKSLAGLGLSVMLGKSMANALEKEELDKMEQDITNEEMKKQMLKFNLQQVQEQMNTENVSDEDIELPDDKEEIDELLESRDQQQEGALFQLFFCGLFIALFILEIRLDSSSGMTRLINRNVIDTYLNSSMQTTVMNVSSLYEMERSIGFMLAYLYTNEPFDPQNHTLQSQQFDLPDPSDADSFNKTFNNSTKNNTSENSDDDEKDNVMPKKRTTLYTQPTQDLKGINKTFPGYNYQEEGGFDDEGGFIKYFPGNATRNETYAEYRKITNAKWFYNNMIRTAVELMFYNNNDEMGILIQIVFFKSNTGELTVSKRQFTYLPQNYDEQVNFICLMFVNSLTRPMIILKLLIFIAFFIMMFTLFIKTLVIVISRIKQFFVRRTLDLHWYTYIDMVVVSLCISSATLWFILFIKTRETFKLPIQKEEDFNAWAVFASRMRLYIRISAMCVVLMSIRNLRVLTTQFPAFGVLFDTIRRAKIDLIYFFIFVLILGISAMVCGIGFFGQEEARFYNPNAAIMTLFQMMFGKFYYSEMAQANQSVAPLFFIPYILLFYFIIINFFSKKQLVTEAMADIVAREANQAKEIWINFFCCRIKQPKQLSGEDDDDNFDVKKANKSEKHQDEESEFNDPSLRAKIFYNLNQVKNLLSGQNQLKTREQFEEELNKAKMKILKRKKLEKIRRKQKFTNPTDLESYIKLKESLIFLMFILIYVIMLLYQTNNKSSQRASNPIKNLVYTTPFNQTRKNLLLGNNKTAQQMKFDQINDPDDMFDFLSQIVVPFIYEDDTIVRKQNIGISDNYVRGTFRFINNSRNLDNRTNFIFPSKQKSFNLGSGEPNAKNSDEIVRSFISRKSNLDMKYNSIYDPFVTFQGNGGFELYLTKNQTQAQDLLQKIYDEDWMYYGLAQMSVDYVVYNPNYKKMIYNYIQFQIDASGKEFDLPYNPPANASKFQIFIMYLGIDYKNLIKSSALIILMRILLGLIIHLIRITIKILKVFWRQATSSFYSLNNLVQTVLSITSLVLWFQITIGKNFIQNDFSQNLIQQAAGLAELQESYRILSHFNVFITFLRILQFFTFSKKLSAFSEILASAKGDIMFFVIMFAMIIFGYAVAGYTLFGTSMVEFRTIFIASLELLRMIMSDFNYAQMYQTDSIISGVYFISYLIIFKIALLNMFIAIIVAHYNEFRRLSEEEEEVSFFQVIFAILKNNLFQDLQKREKILCFKKCRCCNLDKIQKYLFGGEDKQQKKKDEEKYNQEKEASNMNQILLRVGKPDYKDYQLSFGMKSYFADKIHSNQNFGKNNEENNLMRQQNNVAIYKRIEDQGYGSHDQINANFWLFYLEESLQKLSQNRISIYDMQQDETIFSKSFENVDPEQLNTIQKELLVIPKTQIQDRLRFVRHRCKNIYQKYDIWKALDFEKMIKIIGQNPSDPGLTLFRMVNGLSNENEWNQETETTQSIQFKFLVCSQLFSMKFNKVTKFQHHLWTQLFTKEDKYMLWFEIFTTHDRTANTLPQEELQRIRDKFFNSKVMLYIWNQLKKRHFEIPRVNQNGKKAKSTKENKRMVTLTRKEYVEMLRSMFKLMIGGLSNDRLKIIERLTKKGGGNVKFEIYKKLQGEIFDESEYRLSLWLPLTQQQKLDMILHQRIEEEMEIMIFLLDEEIEQTKNMAANNLIDLQIERALDSQIFDKYIQFARYQATRKSLEMCIERLNKVHQEDGQLIEYAAFLHQKLKDLESLIFQLKQEVQKKKKYNDKKTHQIEDNRIKRFQQLQDQKTLKRQKAINNAQEIGDSSSIRKSERSKNISNIMKRKQRFPGVVSQRSGRGRRQNSSDEDSQSDQTDELTSQELSSSRDSVSMEDNTESNRDMINSSKIGSAFEQDSREQTFNKLQNKFMQNLKQNDQTDSNQENSKSTNRRNRFAENIASISKSKIFGNIFGGNKKNSNSPSPDRQLPQNNNKNQSQNRRRVNQQQEENRFESKDSKLRFI
eukprot:403355073